MAQKTIPQDFTSHVFEKQNLMTIINKTGNYDLHKCKYCGIKAKVIQLGTFTFDGRYSESFIKNCARAPKKRNS